MRIHHFPVGIILTALFLSACQTPIAYQRIGYGPDLEYSKAECANGSTSAERGYFAMGSPGYVLGAQLGNAIDNEVRKAEYMKNCMVMHGWRGVSANELEAMKASKPLRGSTPVVDANGKVLPQSAATERASSQLLGDGSIQLTPRYPWQAKRRSGVLPPPLVLTANPSSIE